MRRGRGRGGAEGRGLQAPGGYGYGQLRAVTPGLQSVSNCADERIRSVIRAFKANDKGKSELLPQRGRRGKSEVAVGLGV